MPKQDSLDQMNKMSDCIAHKKIHESILIALKIEQLKTMHNKDASSHVQHSYIKHNNIKSLFPITSVDQMKTVDEHLEDEETKMAFISYIGSIGDISSKEKVYCIMRSLYDDRYAMNCSWQGMRGNIRVDNTKALKLVKEYLMSEDTNFTEKHFDSQGAAWFRQAAQRYKFN